MLCCVFFLVFVIVGFFWLVIIIMCVFSVVKCFISVFGNWLLIVCENLMGFGIFKLGMYIEILLMFVGFFLFLLVFFGVDVKYFIFF